MSSATSRRNSVRGFDTAADKVVLSSDELLTRMGPQRPAFVAKLLTNVILLLTFSTLVLKALGLLLLRQPELLCRPKHASALSAPWQPCDAKQICSDPYYVRYSTDWNAAEAAGVGVAGSKSASGTCCARPGWPSADAGWP